MRVNTVVFAVAVVAAVMFGAQTAMAADPIPAKTCTTPNGWIISTNGLEYSVAYDTTTITYTVLNTSGATPDHVGTFVRKEAGEPSPSGSYNISTPCGGDSTFGISSGAICHERIVRFNNQQTKGSTFTLSVVGKRLPIDTSVIVKKGNSQAACAIEGFGFEDTPTGSACVPSCGDFDEHQSITVTEIFKFKGCEVGFDFNTTTGQVVNFYLVAGPCSIATGPVGDLKISGPGIGTDVNVSFGDGWVSSGNDSCITRVISGTRYTTCF